MTGDPEKDFCVVFLIFIFTLITILVGVMVIFFSDGFCNKKPYPRWKWSWILIAGVFSFLWLPWLCFGLRWAYRANDNAINYIERPDVVIPKDPKMIDLRKEKP